MSNISCVEWGNIFYNGQLAYLFSQCCVDTRQVCGCQANPTLTVARVPRRFSCHSKLVITLKMLSCSVEVSWWISTTWQSEKERYLFYLHRANRLWCTVSACVPLFHGRWPTWCDRLDDVVLAAMPWLAINHVACFGNWHWMLPLQLMIWACRLI